MSKSIFIRATSLGVNTGPFLLYHTAPSIGGNLIGNPLGYDPSALIAGITISGVPDDATMFYVVSQGICSNYGEVFIPLPSPTPSVTPSSTPAESAPSTPPVTPSLTPSNTPSLTPSKTPSISISVTPSNTPGVSRTPSSTPASTPPSTPSMTPSISVSKTPPVTPSRTPTITPTITPTNTPSISVSTTPPVTVSSTPPSTVSSTPPVTVSSTPPATVTPSPTPSPPTRHLYTAAFIACGGCPGSGTFPDSIYSSTLLTEGYYYANPAGSGIVQIGTYDGVFSGTGYTFGTGYVDCSSVPC